MISLPREYIIAKFYEYGRSPVYNSFNNVYQCSCPVCRESLKKKRCYYIPDNDNIFCHNCGWSSKPLKWIKEVSSCSDHDIIEEVKEYDVAIDIGKDEEIRPKFNVSTLPSDCINLFDETQVNFYRNNNIVRACNHVIESRRLKTACNRPSKLYVSLNDRVHKNRLVIPFVNETGNIEFYQTRTILNKDNKTKPKYLGKVGSEKTLFNIDRVNPNHDTVYIFEGPIDAFFVRNSVAVAGITERGRSFTQRQEEQLTTTLKWYSKVWILDSQWGDRASMVKSEALLKQDEQVFIWPEKLGRQYKDFNDLAIAANKNEISWEWIRKNTYRGLTGIVKMAEIKKFNSA